jgi:hypothetical protein
MTAPVLHGFIALWGLLDCFFGLGIFKATVKIMMGAVGAVAGAAISLHFWPESMQALLVALSLGLVAGILLGWYLWKASVVLTAVLAGLVLSAPLAASLGEPWVSILPIVVGVVAGALVFILMEPVIIGATAITGAFRLVCGASFFLFGYPNLLEFVGNKKEWGSMIANSDLRIAGATIVVAAIGCYVQMLIWHKHAPAKHEEQDEE